MIYSVDGWNNFCRVFEIPESYPKGYWFDAGKPVNFVMVAWFNPISDVDQITVSKEVWQEKVGEIEIKEITHDELYESLIPWLLKEHYVKLGRDYLVLCDFGAALQFSA